MSSPITLDELMTKGRGIGISPYLKPLKTFKTKGKLVIYDKQMISFQKFCDMIKFNKRHDDFDMDLLNYLMARQPEPLTPDRSNEQSNVIRSNEAKLIRALIQVSKDRKVTWDEIYY